MNRIDIRFAALKAQGRKALIPFVTAGDPSLEATVPVMHALVDAGADVIELGVPFSDPDGRRPDDPAQFRTRARARGGAGVRVRQRAPSSASAMRDTPVVLMGYLNPVEIRGAERFASEAVAAGVDGVLLVDLPPEEVGRVPRGVRRGMALALILLASPTTTDDRMRLLCDGAQGYLYYVSFAGVTGADRLDTGSRRRAPAGDPRAAAAVPVVAGFGIKDAASAAAMAREAEGVVVGSALVAALADATAPDAAGAHIPGAIARRVGRPAPA